MSAKKRQPAPKAASPPAADEVIATLKKMASAKVRDGMARYAIPADNAFGVSVGAMRSLAKKLGRNHDLAADLLVDMNREPQALNPFEQAGHGVDRVRVRQSCRPFQMLANHSGIDHVLHVIGNHDLVFGAQGGMQEW